MACFRGSASATTCRARSPTTTQSSRLLLGVAEPRAVHDRLVLSAGLPTFPSHREARARSRRCAAVGLPVYARGGGDGGRLEPDRVPTVRSQRAAPAVRHGGLGDPGARAVGDRRLGFLHYAV